MGLQQHLDGKRKLIEVAHPHLCQLVQAIDANIAGFGGKLRFGTERIVVGHRLFAVAILARINYLFEMSRVLEVSSRDQHGVHVFEREQFFHKLEGARRSAIIFGRLRRRNRIHIPRR